ncbi:3-oxoacyl-[acyl-carrier-protein] synthase III C-terminal domain-containing protein [Pseudoalteromonas luteoviolacea]|uniref:3-oxoacyl-[acyl-carrier-protein] synthase III C-terminal domain-containing protein n=1 Tax=Pseudoalteromonas luteoviolacea TaxID=43657 RepID=UPI00114FF555|nr:3-oxoacyl-[acyl-carrier-protein] synthase III C-terminal domain-containing protein [Pseudoalteromonas luteoviolacea]TQF72946.1 hypothetical protein FLM44_18755 [Pseudoalteromonas luteoviolacea]
MLSLDAMNISLPERRLDIAHDFEELGIDRRTSIVYSRMYGFRKCPVISSNQTERQYLMSAAVDLVKREQVVIQDIRYIIHAHTGQQIGVHGDSLPTALQRKLGAKNCISFGTQSNKCVSLISSLNMLRKLLKLHPKGSKALLLLGEVADTKEMRLIDAGICGDSATAILISLDGDSDQLLGLATHTQGRYFRGIWDTTESEEAYNKYLVDYFRTVIDAALADAGVTLEDVSYIAPHNVNINVWKKIATNLPFPLEKIYLGNIPLIGHCFGSDLIINYHDIKTNTLVKKGDLCLLVTAGVGGVFGAAVIKY